MWPCILAFLHLASVIAIWRGVAPFRPPGIGMMPLRGIFSTCTYSAGESQAPLISERRLRVNTCATHACYAHWSVLLLVRAGTFDGNGQKAKAATACWLSDVLRHDRPRGCWCVIIIGEGLGSFEGWRTSALATAATARKAATRSVLAACDVMRVLVRALPACATSLLDVICAGEAALARPYARSALE